MSAALSAKKESSAKFCPGAFLHPCEAVCMTADAPVPLVDRQD